MRRWRNKHIERVMDSTYRTALREVAMLEEVADANLRSIGMPARFTNELQYRGMMRKLP